MLKNVTHVDAVLAEYAAVRREIEQLNREIFLIMSASLSLDFVALGWLFNSRVDFQFRYVIVTIAILSLATGDFMLLTRNRLAHRLALFQKYFIESRLSDICWGRVYFAYRSKYGKASEWGERLARSASYTLFTAISLNIVALLILWLRPMFILLGFWPTITALILHGLRPAFTVGNISIDGLQTANFTFAVLLLIFDLWMRRALEDHTKVDSTMKALAEEWGLAGDAP